MGLVRSMRQKPNKMLLLLFFNVLTFRTAQSFSLAGSAPLWDLRFWWGRGRSFVADGVPSSTSEAHGQRPYPRLLAESSCYSIMAPKVQLVAMMFLVREKVQQESIWRDWLLPTSRIVHPDIECDAQIKKCYKEHVLTEPARSIYDEQGFFTFYVHAKPGVPAFRKGSIFYQREVKNRIETQWGSHTLSQATRLLLKAALENPLNQRFALICGTSIPVRPARFAYSQLIGEKGSRFLGYGFTHEEGAVEPAKLDWYRHPLPMQEEWPELARHTTGHGQFWVLIRKHAEVVDADEFVDRLFVRHCFASVSQRGDVESRQWCVSDEQYVGTVLNRHFGSKMRKEVAYDDPAVLNWINGNGYEPENINIALILKARNSYNMSSETLDDELSPEGKLCHATESPQWRPMVLDNWVDKCTEYNVNTKEQPPVLSTIVAYPHCPLFVRKFQERTTETLRPLLREMRIISGYNANHQVGSI